MTGRILNVETSDTTTSWYISATDTCVRGRKHIEPRREEKRVSVVFMSTLIGEKCFVYMQMKT